MSRQSEQDDRWLGGYRRIAALILLLVILATLIPGYRAHRAQALAVTLSLLGEQFAERLQRLHGLWLDERRPDVLYAAGEAWLFDPRGWPIGLRPAQSPSANCRQLWLALMGEAGAELPPLQFLARRDGDSETNSGIDSGIDSGRDSGTGSGIDSGTDRGVDSETGSGTGCEIGWEGYRLVYHFSDGRVRVTSPERSNDPGT